MSLYTPPTTTPRSGSPSAGPSALPSTGPSTGSSRADSWFEELYDEDDEYDEPAASRPAAATRHRRPSAASRLWQPSEWSRYARPLMMAGFVLLAGVALTVALRTDPSGPPATQVVENSSDPFGVDAPAPPGAEDSGTAFGVIEVTATPTAGSAMESAEPGQAGQPSADAASRRGSGTAASPEASQARRAAATQEERGSQQPQDRPRRPAATTTARPVPQQTAPAPKRAAPSQTPAPTPTDEGLLGGLFG